MVVLQILFFFHVLFLLYKILVQNSRPKRVEEFLKDIKRHGSLHCELFHGLEIYSMDNSAMGPVPPG